MPALDFQYIAILETFQIERIAPLRSHQDFRYQPLGYPWKQVRHHG